jgi:hypothetical protein
MTTIAVVSSAALAVLLACGSAQAAGINRAWVSGHGTDAAGCGAPTTPCRSLQYVHDHIIADGGEIDILDPAGYGAIFITKSLSIVNDGVGTAGIQSTSGAPISINVLGAGSTVTLKGLNIDGLGTAVTGIALSAVGKLTISDCLIRHFANDAVDLGPTSTTTLAIIRVTAADNGGDGFHVSPVENGSLTGIVDHSYGIDNGGSGLAVFGANTTGKINVTATNDNFSSNGDGGLVAQGAPGAETVEEVNTIVIAKEDVADYDQIGYDAKIGSVIVFSRSEALIDSLDDTLIESGGFGQSFNNNEFFAVGSMTSDPPH